MKALGLRGVVPLCAVLASPGWVVAHDEPDGRPILTVEAVRATAAVDLDGRLDDAVWAGAPAATEFLQKDPDEGQPPSERTELRVAYDDHAIYFGLRLFDSQPAGIVRRLSRRDDQSEADRVAVYLDPHFDHRTGVFFEVSAAGVQRDAVIFNDSWTDSSWDGVWESAVRADEQGWVAELRIPLSELRFSEREDAVWGINVLRTIQRKAEKAWLQLVPKSESGLASRMAHLIGLGGIPARRHLALLPYALGKAELAPADPGDPFHDGSRWAQGLGLDLKYGLGGGLTLDATLNPDFGQVEVDPAVVNLSDFETFFQEKRPFFVEGAQIFSNFGRNGANNFWGFNRSEPTLFYSRRIGRAPQGAADAEFVDRPPAATILAAAKVTGKTAGGWSLGFLEAVTAREWANLADGAARRRQEVEPLTNYFVGRAHREFGRAGLGLLATAVARDLRAPDLEQNLASRAYVAGADGYVFLSAQKDWVLTGSIAGSHVSGSAAAIEDLQRAPQRYYQRPDAPQVDLDPTATSLAGWTGSLNLNRNGGNLQANAALWATSPGFESGDVGFVWQTDRFGAHVAGTWRKTVPDGLTRRRSLSIAKWYVWNFNREPQGNGLNLFWNAQLRNYWFVGGMAFKRWRVLSDRLTRGGPSMLGAAVAGGNLWFESDSRKAVSVSAEAAHSRNEFEGWEWDTMARVNVKPSSSLTLSLGPNLTRTRTIAQYVGTFDDAEAGATHGSRYVFADLRRTEVAMAVRVNWILTPRMSVQLYAQPLVSVGDYFGFKELARPRSYDFRVYGVDTGTIGRGVGGEGYVVDPDGFGPARALVFDEPDFNYKSLRVNAVFRWEWQPGSTVYAVWTQQREDTAHPGLFALSRDVMRMLPAGFPRPAS